MRTSARALLGFCRRPVRLAHTAASYVPQAYRSAVRIAAASMDAPSGLLHVEWSDGARGAFNFAWLRDNAPAEHTFTLTEINKARSFVISDLSRWAAPAGLAIEEGAEEDAVRLTWEEGKEAQYSATWLRSRNMSDPALRRQRTLDMHTSIEYESWPAEKQHEPVTWKELMDEGDGMLAAFLRLMSLGFLHVTEMEPGPGRLDELFQRLGYFQNTHYGPIFEVKPKKNVSNLAYTVGGLGLHTDQPYLSEPPQIQALHCVLQSEQGGGNTFADGFRVAEALKAEQPEVYDLLCSTTVEYMDWGVDKGLRFHMAATHPVFQLRPDGRLDAVFYSNHGRSWFVDAPPEKHKDIFAAMMTFEHYCHQPRHRVTFKLKSGEMVMFFNNRVLHGREPTGPDRHVQGCYFSFDAIRSKIRVIYEGRGVSSHASF